MKLAAWLHLKLFQLVVLVVRGLLYLFVKVPVEGTLRLVATVLAWMNIMVKLWLGILAFGVLAYVAAAALLKVSPAGSNWQLVAVLICLLWLVALFSAARFTMEYLSIRRVRQSQAFGEMRHGIRELRAGQRVLENAARATEGTPVGGVFKSNRAKTARAAAEEQAAARRRAEEQAAAEAAERRLDDLGADHDPYAHMEGAR